MAAGIKILLYLITYYLFVRPWKKMKRDEWLKGRIVGSPTAHGTDGEIETTLNKYGKSHNPKFFRHADEIEWYPNNDNIKEHPYLKKRNFLGFQKQYRGRVESVNRDGTITMQIVVKNEDEDGKNGEIETFTIKNIENLSLLKKKDIMFGNKDFIDSTPQN